MLQLASLQNDQDIEYEQLLANDELRHPLLVSLRVLLQSKPQKPEQEATATEHSQTQSDNKLSAVVVEVEPCTFSDIPDDSVDTIHGLFVTVSIQSFTVANQSFTVTVSIQSFILSYAVIACKFPWLCYD